MSRTKTIPTLDGWLDAHEHQTDFLVSWSEARDRVTVKCLTCRRVCSERVGEVA